LLLSELQINSRNELFEQLELMSSKDEQLDYHAKVPIAYVSDELFWGWASAYQDIKELDWFDGIYTSQELVILKSLDVHVKRIRLPLPKHLPTIEEFIETPEWKELAKVAKDALNALRAL